MFKSLIQLCRPLVRLYHRLVIHRFAAIDIYDNVISALPFGIGEKRGVTSFGFKFISSRSRAHRDMHEGKFEVEETTIIREKLELADVFVDVGSNIGFYVCMAHRASRYAIAIEPQSKNLRYLYANLLENGCTQVEVYPMGISTEPGIAKLYGPSGTGSSLIEGWAHQSGRIKSTIAVSTLDILLGDRFAGRRLLIKIDVEGTEFLVLQGALKTLDMTPRPTWMLEICLSEYHPSGLNPCYQKTFELFWNHGYEARTADSRSLKITPIDIERWVRQGWCDSGVINYIFLPVADGSSR